jgi:beta-phosphoglucomutase
MKSNIKAIIFDMDGVLIDAKDWHYEALNQALKNFGMQIEYQEHLAKYDGLPTRDKLNILSQEKGLPVRLHSFINGLKQQYTMQIVANLCRPTFIHEYALSQLHREGYKLCVASNSIRSSIGEMMTKAGLIQYLEFYLSNEDVTNGKPDPEIYTKAIGMLNLNPSECLILEDNEHGLAAARASGAHVLKIDLVSDVNYNNIKSKINNL